MKKFILVSAIILLLLSGLALGYYYFGNNPAKPADSQSEPSNKQLLAEAVVDAVPSFNGERLWFVTKEGRMFQTSITGGEREEFIFPGKIENPQNVLWQEKGSDLIIAQNIAGHTRYKYFNAKAKTLSEYSENVRAPAILAGDTKLVYDWVASSATSTSHTLKVADLDTKNFVTIGDLFRDDYEIAASPRKQELVLFSPDRDASLVHVDLLSSQFTDLAESGNYQSVRFSPDGSKLLVREFRQGINAIWIYDFSLKQMTELNIGEPGLSLWTRDSLGVIFARDGLLKEIDLRTDLIKDWGMFPAGEIKSAFLHPFRDILFYIDAQGKLYAISLSDFGEG